MRITRGKISTYTGEAKKDTKLDAHLIDVDKDLGNLFQISHTLAPYLGTEKVALQSSTASGFIYIPLINPQPLATPTNYTGHTALAFCNSNSSLYVYNTSDTTWKVIALT